jgi:hypothetical protein
MKIQAILCSALAIAGLAGAAPITFTISTSGSGTLGGLTFTDATIVFTAVTDTTNILNGVPQNFDAGAATSSPQNTDTVTISGLGSWLLSDPVFFFDDRITGVIGFSDLNQTLDTFTDLLDQSDTTFTTYTMKTALGPISDPIANGTGVFTNIPTSNGPLAFTTNSTNASFAATLGSVPEPGSMALILAAAIPLGLALMRGKHT